MLKIASAVAFLLDLSFADLNHIVQHVICAVYSLVT